MFRFLLCLFGLHRADKVDYTSLKRILELEMAFIEGSFNHQDMSFRSTDKK